jgi:hypothetical protein
MTAASSWIIAYLLSSQAKTITYLVISVKNKQGISLQVRGVHFALSIASGIRTIRG